jgi:hypothetical protein
MLISIFKNIPFVWHIVLVEVYAKFAGHVICPKYCPSC